MNRRTFIFLGAGVLASGASARAQSVVKNLRLVGGPEPSARQLLTASDFSYLGSFKFPTVIEQATSFGGWHLGSAVAPMTLRYTDGQLHCLVARHSSFEKLLDVIVPTELDGRRATVHRDWNVNWSGRALVQPGNSGPEWYGVKWDPVTNRMLMTYHVSYGSSTGTGNPSLCVASLDDKTGAVSVEGPYRFDVYDKPCGGWMTDVPSWFQSRYGVGRLAIGNPNLGQVHIMGSQLHAFTPPVSGAPADTPQSYSGLATDSHVTIRTDRLIYHDVAHPLSKASVVGGPWYLCPGGRAGLQSSPVSPIQNLPVFGGYPDGSPQLGSFSSQSCNLDWFTTHCWIDTGSKHGVLAFGNILGTLGGRNAHSWYGNDSTQTKLNTCDHGVTATVGGLTGPTGGPGVNIYAIYDPTQLGEVKLGSRLPENVTPSEMARLGPSTFGGFMPEEWKASATLAELRPVGSVAFDASTNRLYVVRHMEDTENSYEHQPVVHVFQVG